MKRIEWQVTILCLVLVGVIAGCGTGSCITVGGNYKDATGEITYCFDKVGSGQAGKPVLSGSDGTDNIVLTETDVTKLLDKLDVDKAEGKDAAVKNATPFQRLVVHLNQAK